MGKNNTVAERAYAVAFQVLRGLAAKLDTDISDLIWEDTAHSTAPSATAQEPNVASVASAEFAQFAQSVQSMQSVQSVQSSQTYPVPTMEAGQGLEAQDASNIWTNFYEDPIGHTSMFYTPTTTQTSSNALLAGDYFQTYQQYDPISNNPFMTGYDEENRVVSSERL
jgi:hypothetical protein